MVVGFGSGVASGAFGIGGAVLSTPAIRVLLGTPAKVAVGTTLPVIVPAALTALIAYHRRHLIAFRTAVPAACAGCSFAIVGAAATELVAGEALLVGTAVVIFSLALQMLRRPSATRPPQLQPGVALVLATGAISGFLSGLLGIGGGVILVPVFTVLAGMPVKAALGTSLAVIAVQAIPGTVVHAVLRNIDWTIAAGLSVGVIPGARVGSKLAVAAQDDALRVVVALGLAALALAFGASELRELLR